MLRAFALSGMAGGFLLISPKFRGSVWEGVSTAVVGLEQYSPFSYVGLVAVILFGFLFFLRAASAPR
jgi:hypothetical protein